jgi:mono/diheme cytochrome c family protein
MLHQGVRNMFVAAGVFGLLVGVAAVLQAPLESMADPADFTFIPHPEWYFLWLFQLMKLTQGPLEQLGAPVVLLIIIAFLVVLPFVDHGPERHPARRRWVMTLTTLGLVGISALTWISIRSLPPDRDPNAWSPVAIAGQDIAGRSSCGKCHGADKAAPDLMRGRVAHDNAWIRRHLLDPETIVPGARPVPFDAPTRPETGAVIAYVRMVRAGAPPPHEQSVDREVALAYTTACASCHTIDGDGVNDGPDLSHAGRTRDAAWIATKIVDPAASDPKTKMPSLRDKMSTSQVLAMAEFLAARK